jgi:hypothetical protein
MAIRCGGKTGHNHATKIEIMEGRIKEADTMDLGRLAWLCMNIRDKERARRYAEIGLKKDPYNDHIQRLVKRLSQGSESEILITPPNRT